LVFISNIIDWFCHREHWTTAITSYYVVYVEEHVYNVFTTAAFNKFLKKFERATQHKICEENHGMHCTTLQGATVTKA